MNKLIICCLVFASIAVVEIKGFSTCLCSKIYEPVCVQKFEEYGNKCLAECIEGPDVKTQKCPPGQYKDNGLIYP